MLQYENYKYIVVIKKSVKCSSYKLKFSTIYPILNKTTLVVYVSNFYSTCTYFMTSDHHVIQCVCHVRLILIYIMHIYTHISHMCIIKYTNTYTLQFNHSNLVAKCEKSFKIIYSIMQHTKIDVRDRCILARLDHMKHDADIRGEL